MNKKIIKIIIILFFILIIFFTFRFNITDIFTFENLKDQHENLINYYMENTFSFSAVFFLIYILVTSFSLPFAAILTLAAGSIFGLIKGVILVSFASTIGATIAFIFSRILLKDYIEKKYPNALKIINKGIEKDGMLYLFALRLVAIFPFFIVNLIMGITSIKIKTFFFTSQIGMLAGTIIYINAGHQLSQIDSLQDIFSPSVLISFALLGIFPIISKRTISLIRDYKKMKNWKKPKKFDYNLTVIGAGSAGLVAANIGASVKAKVALIEKNKMGGDCLNTGCVPSKSIIKTSKIFHFFKTANKYGLNEIKIDYDFEKVMNRVKNNIKKIEPNDSIKRYTQLGVDCFEGKAEIITPYKIKIINNIGEEKIVYTRNIIIASGAKPFIPPIKGLNQINYLTSDNIWNLKKLPNKFIILGGGPIGCELTQSFSRLGSNVTQIEQASRIMGREDEDVSDLIKNIFEKEGVKVLTEHKANEVILENNKKYLICETNGKKVKIEFDEILVSVGRKPDLTDIGLEKIGIDFDNRKNIIHNDFMQTNYKNIFVCGDVVGPYQFTHVAGYQAWYASINALFGKLMKLKIKYDVIPWATYVDPEIARVGLNEIEAKNKNIPYEVTAINYIENDRAIADSSEDGFIKILTVPNKDKILGVTIFGNRAADIITEFVFAIKNNMGLNKVLRTIHIYPTYGEINKQIASKWKKKKIPKKLLKITEKYFISKL